MPATHEAIVKSIGLIDANEHKVIIGLIIRHLVLVETVCVLQYHAMIGAVLHRGAVVSWMNSQCKVGSNRSIASVVDVVRLVFPIRRDIVNHPSVV